MDSEEIGRKDEDREKSRQGEETAILFNHEREIEGTSRESLN